MNGYENYLINDIHETINNHTNLDGYNKNFGNDIYEIINYHATLDGYNKNFGNDNRLVTSKIYTNNNNFYKYVNEKCKISFIEPKKKNDITHIHVDFPFTDITEEIKEKYEVFFRDVRTESDSVLNEKKRELEKIQSSNNKYSEEARICNEFHVKLSNINNAKNKIIDHINFKYGLTFDKSKYISMITSEQYSEIYKYL